MASIQSPTQRSTGASHRSTIQSSFSAESDSDSSNAVHVPSISRNGALPRIKSLLESVVDAINRGEELVIPYQTTRSPQSSQGSGAVERDGRQSDGVRFPGRTVQEAKKFGTARQYLPRDTFHFAAQLLTLPALPQKPCSAS